MKPLRLLSLLGLLAVAGAGPETEGLVSDPDANFEIRKPPNSIDWEIKPIEPSLSKQGRKAHLQTIYKNYDPIAEANVYVFVTPLSKEDARSDAKSLCYRWREVLEAQITNVGDRRREGDAKLGGVDGYEVEITGEYGMGLARRLYAIALNGRYAYTYYVDRTYAAVEDEDLDKELQAIRDSFRFLKLEKVAPHKEGGAKSGEAPGGAKPEEKEPSGTDREKIKNSFWKFEMVKPAGLIRAKPEDFDESERANGMVERFNRDKGQSRMLVRLFCKSLTSGQRTQTLEQYRDQLIEQFKATYPNENQRLEPQIEKWKVKRAKESMHLKLVGKRGTTEVSNWFMADCENGRQYRLYVYFSGSQGEKDWAEQFEDLMKNFKVVK